MKNCKHFLIALCVFFVLLQDPTQKVEAATSEWLPLAEMTEVPVNKTFTISFNKAVTVEDIDGIVIFHEGTFLPVTIETKGSQAFVTPTKALAANSVYEVRVFISNKKYKMKFTTASPTLKHGIQYQGKVDVRSRNANNQLIKNINHYIAKPKVGNPINIYVTDDYEARYGKGFAYEETLNIVDSIITERKVNPFAKPDGLLDIFFYTNESNTVLNKHSQALIYFGQLAKYGTPIASEMLMNGSTMPYDFRSSYVHEFIHFFDFHSFMYTEDNIQTAFENYWGPDFNYWLLEGGAEYGGYYFYDYPKNTYNTLTKNFVKPTRESILNYAKQQAGYKKNILMDVKFNSFDDLYKASNNNYGVYLSFFWYLQQTYGYQHIYDYTAYVGKNFKGHDPFTQTEKDYAAKKYFTKTEAEVLQDWLTYFNYFDGELEEVKETTTATANQIFQSGQANLIPDVSDDVGLTQDGTYKFMVNIAEWIPERNHTQGHSFRENSTRQFELRAPGQPTVHVTRNDLFITGSYPADTMTYAFGFEISPNELLKLKKDVHYTLHAIDNHPIYKWVISEELPFIW